MEERLAPAMPRGVRPRWSRGPWVGLAILVLAAGVSGCAEEPPPAPEVLRPVRTVTVAPSTGVRVATFAGVARSGVESRLSFRVSGTVVRVSVELGDTVRRGQELARLDAADYELKVEEAEAGLALAEASVRQAQADYERMRLLYETNNAAKSDLDAARAGAESAAAQVDASRKQLAQARKQVGYTVLRAPSDGAIAAVEIEVNETVQAGGVAYLLTAGQHPEVALAVPEVMIGSVARGQRVDVHFDALPDQAFVATVSEVGVAATGAATTFDTRVRLDEPSAAIRSGMAADVTFRFPLPGGASIFVPPVAIGEDERGRFAFLLEADGDGVGHVRRHGVTVGQLTNDGLEVRSGLSPGDVVVTAGVRRLTDGERVRVSDAENAE